MGVVKLGIGITTTLNGTGKISKEITNTYTQINRTYEEIRSSDGFNFQLPDVGMTLLIALSGLALLTMFKKFSTNNNQENKNEV